MPRERENKRPTLSLWLGSEFPNGVLIAGTVGVRDSLGGGTYGEEAAHWVCSSRQNWDPQHPSSVPSLHDVQLHHKGRNTETRNLKVSGTVSHEKSSPCLRCFSLASATPTESLTHHLEDTTGRWAVERRLGGQNTGRPSTGLGFSSQHLL